MGGADGKCELLLLRCASKMSTVDAKCEYLSYETGGVNTKSRRLFRIKMKKWSIVDAKCDKCENLFVK